MTTEPLIRNVSDTARWVAVYRARETARKDALFRDPFAKRLAGDRGEQIARAMVFSTENSWSFVTRTYLFDQFITEQVRQGVDMVVNLAAGLDARPYRMALPPSLRWVEIDLPEILDYKEETLANERPVCTLERIRLDLSNPADRRATFERLGKAALKALIVTEGLMAYLTREEVASLAQDLASSPNFRSWVLDLASPALLRMLQKKMGPQLSRAPLKFAPEERTEFFTAYGWTPVAVRSMLKTARRLKRLPLLLQLLSILPEGNDPKRSGPWSGVCLFARQ